MPRTKKPQNERINNTTITFKILPEDKERLFQMLEQSGIERKKWLHSVIMNEWNGLHNIDDFNRYVENVNVFVDTMSRLLLLSRAHGLINSTGFKKCDDSLKEIRVIFANVSRTQK